MEVRNCKGCSRLFQYLSGPILCPACKEKLEDKNMNEKLKALKAAFPGTIPVMTGFLFLGMAFGIMLEAKGYSALVDYSHIPVRY